MADDPIPGAGEVNFDLAGEPVTLKCSASAALTLCRQPGGLYGVGQTPGVADRLLGCDLDTMCIVIRAGRGLGPGAVPDLGEKVYATGLFVVRDYLAAFVGRLANGGKPLVAGGGADAPENPQKD